MFGIEQDNDLVAHALKGSARAWDKLVRRHEKRVYNLAWRMTGNRADALDLTQEAFLAVYRNLPAWRGEGVFIGWLLRITSNRAVDFIRRNRSNPLRQAGELDDDLHVAPQRTDSATEQLRLQQALHTEMQQLSAEQRQVVELKFFQHLTFEEIADQIGIPENTAKTRLYSALKNLRRSEVLQHAR